MDNINAGHPDALPADETPARITLTEDAPRGTFEEGTESSIVIEASAATYPDLFAALKVLNEEGPRIQFTMGWVYSRVSPGQVPDLLSAGETEDFLTSVVTSNHSPFITYSAPVVLDAPGEDGRQVSINLTVTAPSIYTGMQALKHLTTPKVLESTARGISAQHDGKAAG